MAQTHQTPDPATAITPEGDAAASPVSLATLSERLNMRPAEIYRDIKAGLLKSLSLDGQTVFNETDITAYMEKRDQSRVELSAEIDQWTADLALPADPTPPPPADPPPAPPAGEAIMPESPEKPTVTDPAADAGRLAESLIRHAFATQAQDVYLDPVESGLRIMVRAERGLEDRGRFSARLGDLVRQAIKSKLGKPEAVSQPVEALTKIDYDGRNIQVQGTIAPTLLGEHVHLRFRDPLVADDLSDLGYTDPQAEAIRMLLDGRGGLLLIGGAADPFAGRHRLGLATMLAAGNRLVVSLEHRVYFKSEILVQLALSNDSSADFSGQMGAALAMSPDVLFIDDIRGAEEAKSVFDAVAAGMLVVTQMPSSGNVESLLRFVDLGISRSVLARNLLGLTVRRQVRKLCPDCAVRRPLKPAERSLLDAPPDAMLADPGSCDQCRNGFRGHRMLHDLWTRTTDLEALITDLEPPGQALREWGHTAEFGIVGAARAALLAGEIAFPDVATLLVTPDEECEPSVAN